MLTAPTTWKMHELLAMLLTFFAKIIENGLYVQSMHNRAKELSSIFCILLLVNALMLYVFVNKFLSSTNSIIVAAYTRKYGFFYLMLFIYSVVIFY